MSDYHIFLSYARKDEQPPGAGWVTAFKQRLEAQHLRYAGAPLRIFYDTESIEQGAPWRLRISRALRTSRVFLAFLSPNYIASETCRWEFEEYLRLEHIIPRGDLGVQQIYFVEVRGLLKEHPSQFGRDLERIVADIQRRNMKPSQRLDLLEWYSEGPQILAQIDVEDRLAAIRANPQSDRDRKIVSLADQMAAFDRALTVSLDQTILAEVAPGNLQASYRNFVGRSDEMRRLHKAVHAESIGLVGAVHGMGGQGKTTLAVQYAYAYAGTYAAGGRWFIGCEGMTRLSQALESLAREMNLLLDKSGEDYEKPDGDRIQNERVNAIVRGLRERVEKGAAAATNMLLQHPEAHGRAHDVFKLDKHILLIFDNVDQESLLAATELGALAGHDWLQIVVTTRLDPRRFGISQHRIAPIPVDDLPLDDALALLRCMRAPTTDKETTAAWKIVEMLNGFTLAVELVGAYLQARPTVTYDGFLERLQDEGLVGLERLAEDEIVTDRIQHERRRQLSCIVEGILCDLPHEARDIMAFAAMFPKDQIVTSWLRDLAERRYPQFRGSSIKPGYPDLFEEMLRDLEGRRFLPPSPLKTTAPSTVRFLSLHPLIADFFGQQTDEERRRRLTELEEAAQSWIDALPANTADSPSREWMAAPLTALVESVHAQDPRDNTRRMMLSLASHLSEQRGGLDTAFKLTDMAIPNTEVLAIKQPFSDSLRCEGLLRYGRLAARLGRNRAAADAFKRCIRESEHPATSGQSNNNRLRLAARAMVELWEVAHEGSDGALRAEAEDALLRAEELARYLARESTASGYAADSDIDLFIDIGVRTKEGRGDALLHAALQIANRHLSERPGERASIRDWLRCHQVRLQYRRASLQNLKVPSGPLDERWYAPITNTDLADRDDIVRAMRHIENRLRALVSDYPEDVALKKDLCNCLDAIGDEFARSGWGPQKDWAALEAYKTFEELIGLRTRTYLENATDISAAESLIAGLEKLGRVCARENGTEYRAMAIKTLARLKSTARALAGDIGWTGQLLESVARAHFWSCNIYLQHGDSVAARYEIEGCYRRLGQLERRGLFRSKEMQVLHGVLKQLAPFDGFALRGATMLNLSV